MSKNIGIYVHVPFCNGKCPYCGFYSVCSLEKADLYTTAVNKTIEEYSKKADRVADTLYFGGGTPTLLGANNIVSVINNCKKHFALNELCEITCETNPTKHDISMYRVLKRGGINRLSMGLQSANEEELKILGRKHTKDDVFLAVKAAKEAQIGNISVDIMLGTPKQTKDSLSKTIDFVLSLDIDHISGYILKVEEGTPFFGNQRECEEELCRELYFYTVDRLKSEGYEQYEISNFARGGKCSLHNLKYWNSEEYLGIGASAHSFVNGKRFFYPNDIDKFISGCSPVQDGSGGDFEEYFMLKLRLAEGIKEVDIINNYGFGFSDKIKNKATLFSKNGLVEFDGKSIKLTKEGFILSNSIISELLW